MTTHLPSPPLLDAVPPGKRDVRPCHMKHGTPRKRDVRPCQRSSVRETTLGSKSIEVRAYTTQLYGTQFYPMILRDPSISHFS